MLHDITLPGWLDSLDHLVVGPTGVWVVASWRRRRLLDQRESNHHRFGDAVEHRTQHDAEAIP